MQLNKHRFDENQLASIEKDFEKELEEYKLKSDAIKNRVDAIDAIHETAIYIEKLDLKKARTFLFTDPRMERDRQRLSEVGRVLKVPTVDTGDDVKELKKSKLKVGDIIRFSGDAPWCLNIWDYPEIWVISVDSIMCIDNAENYDELMKTSIRNRIEHKFINAELEAVQVKEMAARQEQAFKNLRSK